jgi:hypothetical protein
VCQRQAQNLPGILSNPFAGRLEDRGRAGPYGKPLWGLPQGPPSVCSTFRPLRGLHPGGTGPGCRGRAQSERHQEHGGHSWQRIGNVQRRRGPCIGLPSLALGEVSACLTCLTLCPSAPRALDGCETWAALSGRASAPTSFVYRSAFAVVGGCGAPPGLLLHSLRGPYTSCPSPAPGHGGPCMDCGAIGRKNPPALQHRGDKP